MSETLIELYITPECKIVTTEENIVLIDGERWEVRHINEMRHFCGHYPYECEETVVVVLICLEPNVYRSQFLCQEHFEEVVGKQC